MSEGSGVRLWVDDPWASADLSRPHLIGIGGAGMSALARLLLGAGALVSGSDRSFTPRLSALAAAGATVHAGHDPQHVAGASCVIVSSAIDEANVELIKARAACIPVIHRAQALAQLTRKRRSVAAVIGTHGKTSVASMLVHILTETGGDPAYALGGDWHGPATGGHLGSGPMIVVEADESDRSFGWLRAGLIVVTGFDDDHTEQYPTPEALADEVTAWLLGLPEATVIANADDAAVMAATAITGQTRLTYGRAGQASVRLLHVEADDWASSSLVRPPSGEPIALRLAVPGQHTAHNAVAALTAAIHLGVDARAAAGALATYIPPQRRLRASEASGGVRIVDSFAHHPTAIAADLEAVRDAAGPTGRLLVVFQPSTHHRVQEMGTRMGEALAAADEVVLLSVHDPYSRRLATAAFGVADALTARGVVVRYAACHEAARAAITTTARAGDVVVTMGTGDVTELCAALLSDLARERRITPAHR